MELVHATQCICVHILGRPHAAKYKRSAAHDATGHQAVPLSSFVFVCPTPHSDHAQVHLQRTDAALLSPQEWAARCVRHPLLCMGSSKSESSHDAVLA